MNAALGQSGLVLGLLAALAGIGVTVVGLRTGRDGLLRTGRGYVWLLVAGAVIATIAMQRALLTHDFSLSYVASNDSLETPLLYTVTAMWSALQGSILLWALILSGYLAAVAVWFRKRATDPLVAWAMVVGFAVAAFFFAVMLTVSNPFAHVHGAIPTNGPGPDPLLQNRPLVAFHPPMLYLGMVGFTVPFAFAVASLITGRLGEGWLIEVRRWTMVAWCFLTGGLVLGAWWSYQVLGWGGYWSWDPVENVALLPWLTGTAFIHSVMVQERRGMLRVWNLSLVLSTFGLTILGTTLTRSGVLDSVHSFSTSNLGPVFLSFFGLVVLVSLGLLAWRGDRLRSPGSIDSPVSREGAFLGNNLLFAAFAFIVLLGTVFPLIVQDINGSQFTVGAPYFNTMTLPIVICLLFLMAVGPALPWRKASNGLLRQRLQWPAVAAVAVVVACVAAGLRGLLPLGAFGLAAFAGTTAIRQLILATRRQGLRGLIGRANGGMIVHLGVVVIAVAFAASHAYVHQTQVTLRPGQTATFEGNTFKYLGTKEVNRPNRTALEASVIVNGSHLSQPAVSQYALSSEEIGTPAVWSQPTHDVYLTLASTPSAHGGPASIGIIIEPLVMWVWIGGGITLAGGILSIWPGRRRRRPTQAASARVPDADEVAELAGVGGK